MREFTEDQLLTLELRVRQEGVLDRQAALDLIEAHHVLVAQGDLYEGGHKDGYGEGYEDGLRAHLERA